MVYSVLSISVVVCFGLRFSLVLRLRRRLDFTSSSTFFSGITDVSSEATVIISFCLLLRRLSSSRSGRLCRLLRLALGLVLSRRLRVGFCPALFSAVLPFEFFWSSNKLPKPSRASTFCTKLFLTVGLGRLLLTGFLTAWLVSTFGAGSVAGALTGAGVLGTTACTAAVSRLTICSDSL